MKIAADAFTDRCLEDQLNTERTKAKKESGEEDHLKAILEELKKKCSDQEFKMTSDASKVQLLEAQLLSARAKVKRELVEKDQLNAELEDLKKQRAEQNISLEFDVVKVSQLEVQLNAEKVKVEMLEENLQLQTEVLGLKEQLSSLQELSKAEVAAQSKVIRELQSSVKVLEKKVTIAMEREAVITALREALSWADQTGDANVTQARKDGYNDGLRDGRKMGWEEFVKWYESESSKPQMPTNGCAATQVGSSSQVM